MPSAKRGRGGGALTWGATAGTTPCSGRSAGTDNESDCTKCAEVTPSANHASTKSQAQANTVAEVGAPTVQSAPPCKGVGGVTQVSFSGQLNFSMML